MVEASLFWHLHLEYFVRFGLAVEITADKGEED